MSKNRINRIKFIYIITFILINILSSYLLTSGTFLKNLSPYPRNLFMLTNSFFGDFGFLMLFLGLAIIIFKTDYNRAKFLMIVSIILSIVFVGMTVYFEYYGMFFSFYNLAAFASEGGGDAFQFLVESLLLLLAGAKFIFLFSAVLMSGLFIIIFFKNRKDKEFKKSSLVNGASNRIVIGFGMFFVGILIMINGLSAYKVDIDDTWFEDNSTPLYGTQTVGFFNYYIYDAYSYYFTSKLENNEEKINEIKTRLEEYKNPLQKSGVNNNIYGNSKYQGVYAGKNLLMLQLESFNNFVIGLTVDVDGKPVEVTPFLNELVGKSVYFNNYYTNVGIGNTSDSEFTALTGLYPVGSNYTVYEYANADYQTLPKMFTNEGYYAYSAHANTGKFYERATLHPRLYGFDYHFAEEDLIIKEEDLIHTWLNDVDMLEKTIDIMKEKSQNGPVFSFTMTITSHMPYKQPSIIYENGNWFKDKDNLFPEDFTFVKSQTLNNQIVGYLEHVNYTDFALKNAFEYLEETGLLEDTIVVLYGDHGCGIDIYEMFYENGDILNNDINNLFTYTEDENLRSMNERRFIANVPFIIHDSTSNQNSILKPQTISLVRGINSTSRTVANLFGLKPTYYFGVDALTDARTFTYNPRNHDIYADGIVISGQSQEYSIVDDDYLDFYNKEKVNNIINEFFKYKDFNDKLLKYQIFPPITDEIATYGYTKKEKNN